MHSYRALKQESLRFRHKSTDLLPDGELKPLPGFFGRQRYPVYGHEYFGVDVDLIDIIDKNIASEGFYKCYAFLPRWREVEDGEARSGGRVDNAGNYFNGDIRSCAYFKKSLDLPRLYPMIPHTYAQCGFVDQKGARGCITRPQSPLVGAS